MRIVAIRTHLMQAGGPPHTGWSATGRTLLASARNWLFVTIETEDGRVGTGEGSGWPRVVQAAVEDLSHLLIGEDASDIERLWQRMRVGTMGHGQTGVVGMGAVAALDVALWDLKSQAAGMSVAQLLGGHTRTRVPYYTHVSDPETARQAVARGVRAVKLGGVRDVVNRARAIRKAVGGDIDLLVDLHGPPWLTAPDAIAVCNGLEALHPLFVEEPVAPDDLDGWRHLRRHVRVPLAAGERLSTLAEACTFVDERLVDVLQPDTGRFGGLTQMRKLAAVAEAHGLSIAPHSGSLGPVAEFAAVHLLAAIPNALILERMDPDWDGRRKVVRENLALVDGHVEVPRGAGLGVTLDTGFIDRHPAVRNCGLPTGGWNADTAEETAYRQAQRPRASLCGPDTKCEDS